MSEADEPERQGQEELPSPTLLAQLGEHLRPALLSVLLLTLLTGVVFPLALAVPARVAFRSHADGSLISRDGVVVGSELIGQNFSGPAYFRPRPSAAGDGYDATQSGGTNLGPANPKLRDGARGDSATPGAEQPFAGVRELAEEYRRRNGLPRDAVIPIDAVTRSGSGLDPHISPANAALQVARVARERGVGEEVVRRLVAEHTHGRQFGFLGEPRVDVLALNLALDRAAPLAPTAPARGGSATEG
jgi:K+-transporting ATPase ATPase C chain